MNPPTEQLIRDYLNRLSVVARGRLGFSERQSLLDRTRARIEAECGGTNGDSATAVRKALADLGDPIVLVELEANQAGYQISRVDRRYDAAVAGNGHREMAAGLGPADPGVKGREIGEDLLVSGGSGGSEPGRGGGSLRSVLAGLTGAQRRRRRAAAAGDPASRGPSRTASGTRPGGGPARAGSGKAGSGSGGSGSGGAGGVVRRLPSSGAGGAGAGSGGKPSLVPAPRRPAGTESLPSSGEQATDAASPAGRFIRAVLTAIREHTLESLAVVLLGIGGAVYPPIWLIGVFLAIPSKLWDRHDKALGLTAPVFLTIVGTVLVIVFGGQHTSIQDYAFEAWLGAERLARVFALAGAVYLAWALNRGRRQPKLPSWHVPHRLG